MENFDIAREALNTSENAAGSAMTEHAKWMESLEAKVKQFTAAWEELSQAFMDDSFLKNIVDAGTDILSVLTKIIDSIGILPVILGSAGIAKGIKSIF